MAIAFIHATEVSKCYSVNSENYCVYATDINDTMASLDDAREFCVRRNSTLPIITDENIDNVFQRFIVNDSYSLVQNRSVWLDARRVKESVNPHWINRQSSGIDGKLVNFKLHWLNRLSRIPSFIVVVGFLCLVDFLFVS